MNSVALGLLFCLMKREMTVDGQEAQNRLIDHTELNSILKVVMSCQFSVRRRVSGSPLSRAAGAAVGGRRQRPGGETAGKKVTEPRQKMSIWRSRSFNEHY